MTPAEFVAKWRKVELGERQAAQSHFADLCRLVGHQTPTDADPSGEFFCYEKGAEKHGGGDGWADVWKRGYFGWEYKGKHKDLDTAYDQLLLYREALENPPLLVVCDLDRILVHTNFTGTRKELHEIPLDKLAEPRSLEVLRAAFFEPEKLKPGTTSQTITAEAASRIGEIAQRLRDRGLDPHEVARFLDRVIFCLFAEDVGLLPNRVFTQLVEKARRDPERFSRLAGQLFGAMTVGGDFGVDTIRRFDGNLFDDARVLDLTADEIEAIYNASRLDWAAVDASIFGTLFERGLDPDKRSQLGAHYTSRADIETLVEPVVMQPLRREWAEVQRRVTNLLATGKKEPAGNEKAPAGKALKKAQEEAVRDVRRFLEHLAHVHVLDPACGSGNFLYVTLQKLKDLEKEAILFAQVELGASFLPLVGPWQLHGIEINPYAFELAQMTVWIGYLQWIRDNGFGSTEDPVLRPMENFECKDAILDLSDPENPKEPGWPKVDFIVGNPPFLGGKFLRRGFTDDYVDHLFELWSEAVPREADLCCYWFEKARQAIADGKAKRAGLLATQGIRGGANREVLKRIKESGDVFFAVSDREWVLDGARVHVSLIGFDDGQQHDRLLDGQPIAEIGSNLTRSGALTESAQLRENTGVSFMGITPAGTFDIADQEALALLSLPNPHGRPNSDVVSPYLNGADVTRRSRSNWTIDFHSMSEDHAARYEAPFRVLSERVRPERANNRRESYRRYWWLYAESREGMRAALADRVRATATIAVAKHRLFVWFSTPTLVDHALFAFARSDDYFFGVLHSRLHEVWALAQGTQLREKESGFRYTPTTCFETFPFPWPPGQEPQGDPRVEAIAAAAKELDDLRRNWLNPQEWVKEEVLEFPGSVDGPWKRYVHDPDARGIGTVRYPRLAPRDEESAELLKKRTLTQLYNQRPAWLANAHRALDEAVFAAYGWPADLTDEQILERLLALNLERAAAG